jgi:type IV fimbrial biogenesis protein FimT
MKRQSGFTLVELLITLAIAGVLASIAFPNFKTTMQNGRLTTQANDLLGALVFARSQAVSTNRYVTVCSSTDQTSCSSSNAWASGWIICQEPAANVAPFSCSGVTSSANGLLRVHEAITGNNTLTNTSGLKTITFKPNGALNGVSGLYFDVCDLRGPSFGRGIYVYPSGQARVSTTVGKQLNGTTSITC